MIFPGNIITIKENFIANKPLRERKYFLTDSVQRAADGGIAVRYAGKNGLLRAIRTEVFPRKYFRRCDGLIHRNTYQHMLVCSE